jgi:hypothetical protein
LQSCGDASRPSTRDAESKIEIMSMIPVRPIHIHCGSMVQEALSSTSK